MRECTSAQLTRPQAFQRYRLRQRPPPFQLHPPLPDYDFETYFLLAKMSDNITIEDMSNMMKHNMDNMARSDQLAEIGAKVEVVNEEVRSLNKRVDGIAENVDTHSQHIDYSKEELEKLRIAPRPAQISPPARARHHHHLGCRASFT